MPRTRSIKPEFWDDEKLARVSRVARFVFVGLWTCSDDYGVTKGNAAWIKSQLFPYDDDVKRSDLEGWLGELEQIGRIIPFEDEQEKYYYIKHFTDHQKVDHPSRLRNPAVPEDILASHSRVTREPSRASRDETETETETKLHVGQPAAALPVSGGDKSSTNGHVPYAEIQQLFNSIIGDELPSIRQMTDERRRQLKARWCTSEETKSLAWWERYFNHIRESKFLMGRSPPRGGQPTFQATFDWVINKRNFVKVREGNYHRD